MTLKVEPRVRKGQDDKVREVKVHELRNKEEPTVCHVCGGEGFIKAADGVNWECFECEGEGVIYE